MADNLRITVLAALKSWTPEEQQAIVNAAAQMAIVNRGARQQPLTPDQTIVAWYDYFTPIAARMLTDISNGAYDGYGPEPKKQLQQVCKDITVGRTHLDKLPTDPTQKQWLDRIYNKYAGDKATYDNAAAYTFFKDMAKNTVKVAKDAHEHVQREKAEQDALKQKIEREAQLKMIVGNDQRDIDFAVDIERETRHNQAKRVVGKLIAPNGAEYRASTKDDDGYDPNHPILKWIFGHTTQEMSKPGGDLRSIASCVEFKCLVQYMTAAGITGAGITNRSSVATVSATVVAGGYTIARDINGRIHYPKRACDNCIQWMTDFGWTSAPGYP